MRWIPRGADIELTAKQDNRTELTDPKAWDAGGGRSGHTVFPAVARAHGNIQRMLFREPWLYSKGMRNP